MAVSVSSTVSKTVDCNELNAPPRADRDRRGSH